MRVLRHLVAGSAQGAMGAYVAGVLEVLLAPDLLRTNHAALKEAAVELLDALLTSAAEAATAHTGDLVVALVHFASPVPVLLPAVREKVRLSPPPPPLHARRSGAAQQCVVYDASTHDAACRCTPQAS